MTDYWRKNEKEILLMKEIVMDSASATIGIAKVSLRSSNKTLLPRL